VFANPDVFGLIGEAMEIWNGSGNPYDTVAVFVSSRGSKTLQLVRSYGKDASNSNTTFEYDAFNENPGNDQNFVRMMREKYPLK